MSSRADVQNRLVASGLISSEVTAELALYDGLSPSDQALYQDWMEEVSNSDIATRVRSGNPARVPPIYTHDTESNPLPSSSVLVGKAFVVASDASTRPAGVSVVRWTTAAQPSSPQTDDEWMKPSDSTLKRWTGSAWVVVNQASNNATYQALPLVASLSNPSIGAHRCGSQIFPEQTIEAADAVNGMTNVQFLDWDANILADGNVAMMHDSTVDRTTTGTGAVASFNSQTFKTLVADAGSWFAPAWSNTLRVPLLGEVLDRYGQSKVLSIEPKTSNVVAPLIAAVQARNLTKSVIFNTAIIADIATIKAAGIAAHYYFGTASIATLATAVAAAPDAIWVSPSTTDVDVATVVATGIPVGVHTIQRRADYLRMVDAGVRFIVCDEPLYAPGVHTVQTTDSWSSKTYGHGLIDTLGTRPVFAGTNELSFAGTNTQYAIIGEVSPIAAAAGTYTINLDLGFSTLPADTTRWVGGVICANDDTAYLNSSVTVDGYHFLMRANGSLQLFKLLRAGSINTQVGSTISTTALTAGAFAHLTIAVTPSGITVTRTDSGGFTAITTADTASRGAYLHLGKTSTDGVGRFKNLAIT